MDWLDARFVRFQLRLSELASGHDDYELALDTYRLAGTAEAQVKRLRLLYQLRMQEVAWQGMDAAIALGGNKSIGMR